MSERGVSIVALIVTIIIIVVLTTIGGFYSNDVLEKTERMNIENELRIVSDLVSMYRAKIMSGEMIIPDDYLANDTEIDDYLGSDTSVNRTILKSEEKRYYLMNQESFNTVFDGEVNVKDVKRQYLISFEDGVTILRANRNVYVVGEIE